MTRVYDLVVEVLPNMELSSNGRRRLGPWNERRLIEQAKKQWYWLLLPLVKGQNGDMPARLARVRIEIDLTFPQKRRRDPDGMWDALKPIIDILSSPDRRNDKTWRLGLIRDDSSDCIVSESLTILVQPGIERTRIRIEEVA